MNISEEIKQRLDIISVVSESVQLSKAGKNLRGLCPFHTEKTPSFFVFPDRQTWRCFGCGVGGDVISFVMKREGIEFGEALKSLAGRAGVSIPEKRRQTPEDERLPRLYQVNEAAAEYYHQMLLTSETAQSAREYVQQRKLTEEIVRRFRLGFSPDGWENLKKHLKEKGYNEREMVLAGLITEKEDRTYDRFRGRLMFPIANSKGQVAGFGARALDNAQPKYLNSAESPVFKKSDMLYAIDQAKSAIREQGKVVIVEGYMDAITAHQHGFQNVVASMGTALTESQIAILKKLTDSIYLSLDADAAGSAATLRGIEVCRNTLAEKTQGPQGWLGSSTELRANIYIISMIDGKDPDEVIRQQSEKWRQLINTAKPLTDYLFEATAKEFDLSSPEERSKLADQLLPLISQMQDSAVRETYLTKLSKLTGISERVLIGKLADRSSGTQKRKSQPRHPEGFNYTQKTGDPLEETCLCLLLQYPGLREFAGNLSSGHFESSENREIFEVWQKTSEAEEIFDNIDPILQDYLERLFSRTFPPQDRREQQQNLERCISRLEERRLRHQMICEAESVDEGEISDEASKRLTELQHRRATSGWR